jgi:WD40 repeat protein
MTYEPSTDSIILGSNTGIISMWEVSTGKNNGLFKDEQEEITSICFFTGNTAYIYGTSNGNLGLVGLVPIVPKQEILWKGQNLDP